MPEPEIEHLTDPDVPPAATLVGGVWSLSYDGLTLVDAGWTGRSVVLAPTEQVLILAVDLPLGSPGQRLAALPFAIEDQLSEPIEAMHTAIGAKIAPGRYLAGAVRHERMRAWLLLMAESGLERAMLIPDALTLPAPGPGLWSVSVADGRALVRTAEGPAFAVPAAALRFAWESAGRPLMTIYGEALPDGMEGQEPGPGWLGGATIETPALLDLRQGVYASRAATSPVLRRLAMVVALGVLAHVAVFALDTVALMRSAEEKRAVVAVLVAQAGGSTRGDLATTAEAMLPRAAGGGTGFLPLFSQTSAALQPVATSIALQTVAYDATAGLTIAVEASDLSGLQQAEDRLRRAGLRPVSGKSTVDAGRATQTLTLGAAARGR